jgi:putative membrane protein
MPLAPEEAARVEAAFDAAQTTTSAPIVCVLAGVSSAREFEFFLGAAVLALATPLPLLLFTTMSAHRIYIAQLLVAIVAAVLGALPWVRRAIVPRRVERAACHRAALAQFVLRGVDRSQSGVLVYVSLSEHYIRVVTTEGAARAASVGQWQAAVDEALAPLAAGAIETALTGLAGRCAALLAGSFPPYGAAEPPPRQRFHIV